VHEKRKKGNTNRLKDDVGNEGKEPRVGYPKERGESAPAEVKKDGEVRNSMRGER